MIETSSLRKKLLDLAICGHLTASWRKETKAEGDLPVGWNMVKLGEVGEWGAGATPSRSVKEYYEGGTIPWLKTGDLNDGVVREIPEFITELAIKNTPAKINPVGSVLIAMYGATIGKIGILDIEAATNQACCACKVNKLITKEYLYYFLLSQREKFKKLGGGGAQPNISKQILVNYSIPLPPLEEQKAIVKRLEELLALEKDIAADAAALDELADAAKRKILDLAISGKLVPRMGVWKMVKLGDVGEFCGGHTPSKANHDFWGGEYLWVTSKDMKAKYIEDTAIKLTRAGADELEMLPIGTLLMTTRSGILRRTFPVAIARKPCTINQDQKALKIGANILSEYVYIALKAFEDTILKSYVKSGTTVESVIWNKFLNLEIPLPPLVEQKEIVAKVDEVFAIIDAMR